MIRVHNEPFLTFHLGNASFSYCFGVEASGLLLHLYLGGPLAEPHFESMLRLGGRAFSANPLPARPEIAPDCLYHEYPTFGRGDFGTPALQVQREEGARLADLRYVSHTVTDGKPRLDGLPSSYVESAAEAKTLRVLLRDHDLEVELFYTVFRDSPVLARHAEIRNTGSRAITIEAVASLSLDLRDAAWEVTTLDGSWARERHVSSGRARKGSFDIDSKRGASGHEHNPFLLLSRPGAGEYHGEAFAIGLVYSGNFRIRSEYDAYERLRITAGISPFDFSWRLEPGARFSSPEAVLVYSGGGLNALSQASHDFISTHVIRRVWRDKPRPILINNWEATYFNFDETRLLALADKAAAAGMELFVLDDGWFGTRDADNSSLGDWFTDTRKLPRGLDDLAKKIRSRGLLFGLWFEPEMISQRSELHDKHPDWKLMVSGYESSTGRNQFVLDLGRDDVQDYIIESLSKTLSSGLISYVKWDMNRHMTEVQSALLPASRGKETAHRYMLGLYRVLEALTTAFPEVLFEGCSGGGGRFDMGMLHYTPQFWTSDNTDAIERIFIQQGTSLFYPPRSMGCHVSAVPNHQVGRVTSLALRGAVAMAGNFGYELDLCSLPEAELEAIASQVATYKRLRELVQFGRHFRLDVPWIEENRRDGIAWMFVSRDGSQALVTYVQVMTTPNPPWRHIRLHGLDAGSRYRVLGDHGFEAGGDQLMQLGLPLFIDRDDYTAATWEIERL